MSRWWYEDGEEEDEAAGMVMNKRPVFSFYIRAATSKTLRELCLKTNDETYDVTNTADGVSHS